MSQTDGRASDVPRYDVAILGGGAAGLTLALQLRQARPATSILVVEKNPHPVPEAAHKVGESTVEVGSYYLRDVLHLEDYLKQEQLDKFGLRVFMSGGDNSDISRRAELGARKWASKAVGTFQLDRGRLENALGRDLASNGISFRDGCRVQEVTLRPQDEYHRLRLVADGDQAEEVDARWVVDATGRFALLKRQLGLGKRWSTRRTRCGSASRSASTSASGRTTPNGSAGSWTGGASYPPTTSWVPGTGSG